MIFLQVSSKNFKHAMHGLLSCYPYILPSFVPTLRLETL